MGPLQIEATEGGARIRGEAASGRVRAFHLASPPRIVVDFGDPGTEPFELDPGLTPIAELGRAEAPVAEAAPRLPAAAPEAPAREEPAVAEEPAPARPPEAPISGGEPAPPPAEPEPESEAAVEGARDPLPPPAPIPELPEARETHREPGAERRPIGRFFQRLDDASRIEVALWFAVPFLAAAGAIWMFGRLRERRSSAGGSGGRGDVRPAETISSREILEAAERIDVLEKRIDEEVRSRMQLEERATRLQEDLKVAQDRIQRLAHRRGLPE
jgi:hypothetical protein